MKYEELLEIHFWNGESYSPQKILEVINYFKNDVVNIDVDYLDVNILSANIDENIYEKYGGGSRLFTEVDGNKELEYLLSNKFITHIRFHKISKDEDITFYVHFSEKNIYYSVEFGIEEEDDIEEIFFKIQDTYCDLINIFNPLVSNAGFEVVWEDSYRMSTEQVFEGCYGYLSKKLNFPFIVKAKEIELENGYLFMVKYD